MASDKNLQQIDSRKQQPTFRSRWQRLFYVDDTIMDETFSLGDRELNNPDLSLQDRMEPEESPEDQEKRRNQSGEIGEGVQQPEGNKRQDGKRHRPYRRALTVQQKRDEGQQATAGNGNQEEKADHGRGQGGQEIALSLADNLARLKRRFNVPPNKDLIIREFEIPLQPPVPAFIAFIEGIADRTTINNYILEPLMLLANLNQQHSGNQESPRGIIKRRLLPSNQLEEKHSLDDVVVGLNAGSSALFIDLAASAFLIETKGWEHRGVEKPFTEQVVRGPMDAFNENIRTNTALIRRRLKTDRLITEIFKVGHLSNTDIAVMYVEGLTNEKLVAEVIRRIQAINTDFITESGMLEHFIEDAPFGLFPSTFPTERPDRVAAGISEGKVAIIVDGNPFVIIVPAGFFLFLHAAEDYYLRWPFGTLLRLIRTIGMFIAMLLPAAYVAITNYHQEMLPTDLVYSIASSRETVPFPVVIEVLLLEFSFELIREAGIRLPQPFGATIGIVGALILGQAAVQAGIVSPILVIVIAVTGLGSFAMANFYLSFSVRVVRFGFTALAAMFGFFGVGVGLFILDLYLCSLKSFGMPMMAPVAPYRPPSKDIIFSPPKYLQDNRPQLNRVQDEQRQTRFSRKWDPVTEEVMQQEQKYRTDQQTGNTRTTRDEYQKDGDQDGN